MSDPPVPRETLEQIAALMRALRVPWSLVASRYRVRRLGELTQDQACLLLASLDAAKRGDETRERA